MPTRSWTLDAVPAVTAAVAAVSAAPPTGGRRHGLSPRDAWLVGAGAALSAAALLVLPALMRGLQAALRPRAAAGAEDDASTGAGDGDGDAAAGASSGDGVSVGAGGGGAVGAGGNSWLGSWFLSLWSAASHASAPPPYLLLVRLRLRPGTRAAFLALWGPFAQRVRARESPTTLTYLAAVPEAGGPDELFLVQRYASRAALAQSHQKSPDFLAFGRALLKADIVLEKTGEGFFELPQGAGLDDDEEASADGGGGSSGGGGGG